MTADPLLRFPRDFDHHIAPTITVGYLAGEQTRASRLANIYGLGDDVGALVSRLKADGVPFEIVPEDGDSAPIGEA